MINYIDYEQLHCINMYLKKHDIKNSCLPYKDKETWQEHLCFFIPLDPNINKHAENENI